MNEKLEMFAAYLPYKPNCLISEQLNLYPELYGIDYKFTYAMFNSGKLTYEYKYCKPLLYPLSYLTKEIEFEGEIIVPIDYLSEISLKLIKLPVRIERIKSDIMHMTETNINMLPYQIMKLLHKMHFDTGGYITKGWAIDKTTI